MAKIKNLKKSRIFQVDGNVWTIYPVYDGGIAIEMCRPGEEGLSHPEGNKLKIEQNPEGIFLYRAEEPETCDACGLDVPGPHPHGAT